MATTLEQLRTQYPHLSDDAIADLAGLTLRMSGSQKTRKGFLGLIKEVAPETPIPELDTEAKITAAVSAANEKVEKLEKALAEKEFAASLASQKNEARSKFGLSDEDVAKMEEMMKKGELPADYRFAPALYKQQTEVATPTNYGSSGYGPLGLNDAIRAEKAFEGLMDDPDNWSLKTAHSMIDDFKKGRAPAF